MSDPEEDHSRDRFGSRGRTSWRPHYSRGRGRNTSLGNAAAASTTYGYRGAERGRRGRWHPGRGPYRGGRGRTQGEYEAIAAESVARGRGRGNQRGRRWSRGGRAGRGTWRGKVRGTLTESGRRFEGAYSFHGGRYSAAARPLTVDGIRELSTLEPEVLVKRVDSQLKEFQQAIGTVKPEEFDAVVQILSKLVQLASGQEGFEQGVASKIIAEILSAERCAQFHFHLNQIVKSSACTVKQAEDLCNLFQCMLDKFQSLAWDCLPIDELHETAKRLTKCGYAHSELLEKAKELCEARDQIRNSTGTESHLDDNDVIDHSQFRLVPVLPEWNEIKEDNGIPPEVRPNRIDGPYKDWMEYYDIQFRLIREDFIAPLRRGVASFLQGDRGRKNRDVKTYSAAKIVSQVTTKDKGICFAIKFDVTGFRKNWEQSKRLIFGSLLCFIPMGNVASEDNVVFATVADREKLREGRILVKFEGDIVEAMAFHRKKTEFEIIESNSYFGAVDPILRSLQSAEIETMPFTRQLIKGECKEIAPPVYLCANEDEPPIYDLSCLNGSKRDERPPLTIEVLKKESWELARNSELDSSQLNAIQTALTQEIAVIQGPPGTGKTYIGLKIVEGLLQNRHIWDPHRSTPILVMCYTNHALDQFLEGIIDTECFEVIRVGGQCKNQKVDACNLSKVRKCHYSHRFSGEIGQLLAELYECNPERTKRKLKLHHKRNTLLPLEIIRYVANPYHLYQLKEAVQCKEQKGSEVEVWLGLWTDKAPDSKATNKAGVSGATEVERKEKVMTQNQGDIESARGKVVKTEDQVTTQNINQEDKDIEGRAEEKELIDVEGEASLVQDERMDNDDAEGYKAVHLPGPPCSSQESSDDEAYDPGRHPHGIFHHSPKSEYYHPMLPFRSPHRSKYSPESSDDESHLVYDRRQPRVRHFRMYQYFKQIRRPLRERKNSPESSDDESYIVDDPRQPHRKIMRHRKSDADNLIERSLFKGRMNKDEVEEVDDITGLSTNDRWRLYNYWEDQRSQYLQQKHNETIDEYTKKCKRLEELRQLENREILEEADVVGMTTTGAAKYQHILHHIKPKIVIVEEAAEVLEAHIVSALSAGTQHLILIGDHKQLRPKPNEHVLATKYNLSISLFERLVMKEMSQATLEIQHRMRPEIARLVCPHVYEKLLNHESVQKYPDVQGISKNMFFVCHTQPESENPNLLSYQNDFEAKYVAALCSHLLRLGYSPSQITILTPYVGQLLMLQNKLPKTEFEGVRVTAIDNFQGEENDIILFSMVRSTNPHSSRTTIGFMKEDNRVCVSLSRAKHGFYVIGNFELIRQQSPLWESIISDVESRGCYGKALPLYCCNHPETKFSAEKDTDFSANAPNGGCNRMCDIRLPCGHSCTQMCHVADTEHKQYECKKDCELTLSCGHTHTVPCFESSDYECTTPCLKQSCERGHTCKEVCHYPKSCGPCNELVSTKLPNCSHEDDLKCYVSVNPQKYNYRCKQPCEKIFKCGHSCPKECHEWCGMYCSKKVPIALTCGHEQMIECHRKKMESDPCIEQIGFQLACGHMLEIECYQKDSKFNVCKEKCFKLLPCGHPCTETCGKNCTSLCQRYVKKELPCGHKVEYECYKKEIEIKCTQKSVRRYPCGHSSKIPCSSTVERYPCKKNCKVFLSCGHRCSGKCGDCYSSRIHAVCIFEIKLRRFCGHSLTLPCAGLSDSCDHGTHQVPCTHGEDYSKCGQLCSWDCKHYQCERECGEECARPPCNEACDKELSCGHSCPGLCGERCTTVCVQCEPQKFMKQFHPKPKKGRLPRNEPFFELGCGHIFTVPYLDEYMGKSGGAVLPKQCPRCHQTIGVGSRYGNAVKKAMACVEDVNNITMQQASIPESERGELCNGELWQRHGLSGREDPLYFIRTYLSIIEEKLNDDLPVTAVESCLVQCADSSFVLHLNVQDVTLDDVQICLEKTMDKLFVHISPVKIPLSWQFLRDFMSEMYRLALSAQCAIARAHQTPASEASCKEESTEPKRALEVVERFLNSLNPLKGRISEVQYEKYFRQLTAAFPDTSNLHVKTPRVPEVAKGTWMKCPAGHYYCKPPVCGAGAKRDDSCPKC